MGKRKTLLEEQTESLRGIDAVCLFPADDLDPTAEEAGVDSSQFQSDIEAKLRNNDIPVVFYDPEESTIPPTLRVIILTTEVKTTADGLLYFAFVELCLTEDASPIRAPLYIAMAETWRRSRILVYPKDSFWRNVRTAVGDLADDFINDFIKENRGVDI